MFEINGRDIRLTAGDTAAITFSATGRTFTSADRALFTVKDSSGAVKIELVSALVNGAFTVELANSDTDTMASGAYSYDVRYIINPYYSGEKIVDGDEVITPFTPATFTIIAPVGEV